MRRATLFVALAVAGAVLVGDAAGQTEPPPPPDPGVGQISQYIEVIPTAQGGVPTDARKKGRAARKSANLSPNARRKVETEGGRDADALIEVAASSPVAAAQEPLKPKTEKANTEKPVFRPAPRPETTQTDATELVDGVRVAAPATSGRARLIAIGTALFLLTWALVLAARTRVRVSSGH